MELVKSVLGPLGVNPNALNDTFKWVVIGGTVETARRVSKSAWNGFVDSFFLTAHFGQDDYPYDWIMYWLSKQPAWGRTRDFEITTRQVTRMGIMQNTTGDLEDEEEEGLVHGRRKRAVAFMPSVGTTHNIYYNGYWLRITRSVRTGTHRTTDFISISVVARNNGILKKLVLEARKLYEKDGEHRVHIYMADAAGMWRWNGARQKRPMRSIILDPGVKEMLLNDCRDFLQSEEWYAERGIPFRRGYLLHGVPGSGKTSLIHSLAGELGLDIYVASLSSKGMSDNTLATLMGNVPARCILLLEDLDAAFTRGVSRDESSTGAPTEQAPTKSNASEGSTLSLSGLLNALDGVAAAEGRLLFATTNHIERLDPALSRPGRMDVWVNFKNATKWQAEGIFRCFFPSRSSKENEDAAMQHICIGIGKRRSPTHAIPILDEEEIDKLAKRFAEQIPDDEMSVASLQGFLLKNKTKPRECVEEVSEWIEKEREQRLVLMKQKEQKESEKEKAKKEKEEKEQKEKEAKEKEKEKAEKKDAAKETEKVSKKKAQKKSEKILKHKALVDTGVQTQPQDDSCEENKEDGNNTAVDSSNDNRATNDTGDSDNDSTSSSSRSSSLLDVLSGDMDSTSGNDADDSVTSEEEDINALVDRATTKEVADQKTGKWVNVKSTNNNSSNNGAEDVEPAAVTASVNELQGTTNKPQLPVSA